MAVRLTPSTGTWIPLFNVLEATGNSWKVYCDTALVPCLTYSMFPRLWPYALNRFAHFDDFKEDCRHGALPRYTFIEPSFVENPNDEHPPHDVVVGEQFLYEIWMQSAARPNGTRVYCSSPMTNMAAHTIT
jgi:phospholipase C